MKIRFNSIALLTLFFAGSSHAQVMSAFVREQTGTLPRGRFMISMVSVQSSIDRMYKIDGTSKSLSSNFNQNVSFQKIIDEEPIRGAQLSGLFLSNGMNLSDSVGELQGSVTGTVKGKVPVVGYGLTDDMGIFLSLPVIEFNINAQYQFRQSAQAQNFLSQLKSSDQTSVAKEFAVALNTSLENKLYRDHYDWNSTLNKTYLGDVQINVVKILSSQRDFKAQIQPFLILPTATDQDLRDLYGLKAGDHRFGLGLKYGVQKNLNSFQLNASLSGTHLFPVQQGRRLPKDSSDDLNENLDESVFVAGGDRIQSQAQVRYQFPRWLGLNVGMNWQKKWNESLSGSKFEAEDYRLAEAKTGSSLLSSYASLDLNSIPSFLDGNFLFPAVAELGVGLPISGKNAIAEPVIQLQGTMFF